MNRIVIIFAIAASIMLTGCGAVMDIAGLGSRGRIHSRPGQTTASIPGDQTGTPPAELGSYGPKTNPYTVLGKRYYPLKTAYGYNMVGTASWYGSENHGMQTASGAIYNMHSMSAAHKTLPLGTVVRVTSLENNRSVDLLINDRGPFVGTRIIDLSYGAAKRLNFAGKGLARVRVTAIRTVGPTLASNSSRKPTATKRPVTSVATAGNYFVQVGAFSMQANAAQVRDQLRSKGYTGSRLESERGLYLVKAGPFSNKTQAAQALSHLRTLYPSSFIAAL